MDTDEHEMNLRVRAVEVRREVGADTDSGGFRGEARGC
jgi:hypothetical protein